MNLDCVAAQITIDLKEVVFVGAYAVVTHTGVHRTTQDLDLALASPIGDGRLEQLGYQIHQEGGKRVLRTRDGIKMDVFTEDVSGISIQRIFETAATTHVGDVSIKVMGLEALLVAKMRAARPSRPQDNEDLRNLCRIKGKSVRWDVVRSIASEMEVKNLQTTLKALSR